MKNLFAVLLMVIVVGGAGVYVVKSRNVSESMDNNEIHETEIMMEEEGAMMEEEGAMEEGVMMESEDRYLVYSPEVFAAAEGTKQVLYFYANWCPTCGPADVGFMEGSDRIPEDMVVIRVNYNDTDTDQAEKELANKYEVTYQHTYVQLDEQGEVVTKWNGGGLDELLSKI